MNKRKSDYLIFSLISTCMIFFTYTGVILQTSQNILWTFPFIVKALLISILGGTLIGILLFHLFNKLVQWNDTVREVNLNYSGKQVFFFCFAIIFLAWLPCFLAFYPGLCAYDSTIQINQFLTGGYNNHHPLLHTLLIQFFYQLGDQVFSSPTLGIAFYTLFQMFFLGGCFSASITMLYKLKVQKRWLILLLVYSSIFPFHMLLSVSITKDILFSGLFLLLVLVVYQILYLENSNYLYKNKFHLTLWDLSLCLLSFFMIMMRNNGKYVVLVLVVLTCIILIFQKSRRILYGRLFTVLTLSLLLSTLCFSLLDTSLQATSGDKREMFSLPIQQIARTISYEKDSLSDSTLAFAHELIEDPGLESYVPTISDPVKSHFVTWVVKNKPKEFLQFYLDLFMAYPGDYVNAFLALDGGYLNLLDTSHANIYSYQDSNGLGYVQTATADEFLTAFHIKENSLFPWYKNILVKFCDENLYLSLPVLKYLFTPATYLWLFLFMAAGLCHLKKYQALLPLSLLAGYYLTCFLGPTVQLRYIYPIMISIPFIFVFLTIWSKNKAK